MNLLGKTQNTILHDRVGVDVNGNNEKNFKGKTKLSGLGWQRRLYNPVGWSEPLSCLIVHSLCIVLGHSGAAVSFSGWTHHRTTASRLLF